MISILLDYIFKSPVLKQKVVRYTFFVFQGMLAGILMNDILRILYGDFDKKQAFEYGIAAFVAGVPFIIPQLTIIDHKTNNISLGAGLALGTWMATRTENKQRIVPI